jgi:2-C-methyl-D-erythritol 4-phosphate cytidylyltransferase/2-C-methyl-D-erythritol 2,4-cyclodiphosphate synthase
MPASKIAAIIVAAGRGHRAGGDLPKQYRLLDGEPVLRRTVKVFTRHPEVGTVVVVIHPDDQDLFEAACESLEVSYCYGGDNRSQSVRKGLAFLESESPSKVLVHDGARPHISAALIDRLCEALSSADAVVPVLPVVDATYTLSDAKIGDALDREHLARVQTPQGFDYKALEAAFAALPDDASLPDETAVMRASQVDVSTIDGDPANIKLTFAEDFDMPGVSFLTVSGSGFDVHRLGPGDGVWLCGVKIPCELHLVGHSDADAGLHALTDALLGTIGAGDIGQHFPPSDPAWKGAASTAFVEHAVSLVHAAGGEPVHADITLICEKPKIGPHREKMRETVAALLGLPLTRVNIKATTTEGLGFTGRSEGIAAQAIATVKINE